MSTEEFNVYLTEMEQEIRAADRDMRDIEALEKRDVLNSGKLGCLWFTLISRSTTN